MYCSLLGRGLAVQQPVPMEISRLFFRAKWALQQKRYGRAIVFYLIQLAFFFYSSFCKFAVAGIDLDPYALPVAP